MQKYLLFLFLTIISLDGCLSAISASNTNAGTIIPTKENSSETTIPTKENSSETTILTKENSNESDPCSNELGCSQNPPANAPVLGPKVLHCNSHYGGFPKLDKSVQALISKQLETSNKYLLLSTRFNHWKTQRKGFYDYFQKLSDAQFDEAIVLIEEFAKRGGSLSGTFEINMPPSAEYQLTEMEALSKALDMEKGLAKETENLMHHAFHGNVNPTNSTELRSPDLGFSHFVADKISGKQKERVHKLASHVQNLALAMSDFKTDLDNALKPDLNLILYVYDTQFMQ